MPMQPANLPDIIKALERRITALERGQGRWGVTYRSESLQYVLLTVDTATPGIGFWGEGLVTPETFPAHPTTLEDVINVLTLYGLTA